MAKRNETAPPEQNDSQRTDTAAAGPSQREQDRGLATRVAAGDAGAFDVLHGLYRERVYAFALKRLRDAAEADDVCQDVFLQIFRCIGSYEGRSSLLTWMFGITHHQICRRYRRRNLATYSLDAPEAAEVSAETVGQDRQVDAVRALESCGRVLETKVTAAQREVFALRYGRGYSTRAIADELGRSRQAVKISLFRTRRTLSSEMASAGLSLSA
jgi:RNA polymerase sigma-70 factor (ECF subfamily)